MDHLGITKAHTVFAKACTKGYAVTEHCEATHDAAQLADKDPAQFLQHKEKHADSQHTGNDANRPTVTDEVLDHPEQSGKFVQQRTREAGLTLKGTDQEASLQHVTNGRHTELHE